MFDNDYLLETLERWEEFQRQGKDLGAEELCLERPELLDEVKRALPKLRRFNALIDRALVEQATPPTLHGYEDLTLLGHGGMGVVYKAWQTNLKRLVSLKMISAGVFASPQELSRFRGEAEAVARLQHPNIVQIHDIGEQEGRPYFAMEFVESGSLAQKLAGKPLPPREAAELVETLARAMHYAHLRGVIHRDLKPANVMLTADGTPKITDFGLAKCQEAEARKTRTGTILGTPTYMSPEQAAGEVHEIGPTTDVYALGAILYEALTGRPPFVGANVWDTLDQVRSQEPVPPSRLQPKVPRNAETICLKCLRKEPGKRYASARTLAEDLRRFCNDEPIKARPVGSLERLWLRCRRKPVQASLALALVALLASGVPSITWLWLQKENFRNTLQDEMTVQPVKNNILKIVKNPDQALEEFKKARVIYERRGWRYDVMGVDRIITQLEKVCHIGKTYVLGDYARLSDLGQAYHSLARVLEDQNYREEPEYFYQKAISYQSSVNDETKKSPSWRKRLCEHYFSLGEGQIKLGRPTTAIDTLTKSQNYWPTDPQELFEISCRIAQNFVKPVESKKTNDFSPQQSGNSIEQADFDAEQANATKEYENIVQKALEALKKAKKAGFANWKDLQNDRRLDSVREDDDFKNLVSELRNREAALLLLGASTVGLMNSPAGQSSLVTTATLFPGRLLQKLPLVPIPSQARGPRRNGWITN